MFNENVIIIGQITIMSILDSVDKYTALFDNIKKYEKKIDALNKTIKYINNRDLLFLKNINGI